VLVVLAVVTVVVLYVVRAQATGRERTALAEDSARGPRVRVTEVRTTSAPRVLSLPGDVRGYQQATLYAKLSGYVKDVLVNRGDRVTRDQLIATLWSPETEDDARSAEHSAEIARITATRYDGLAPTGVVSRQDRDNADAQHRIAQAGLGRAQSLLEYSRIRAPFSGIVTARYVDPGALVPAATGATQTALPIVDIADVDTLRVFVYVGQDTAPFVRIGNDVAVWQDELPDRRVAAKVTFIAGALDPRTRTMLVEVDFDNRSWGMLPGTFAHVEIHILEPESPLVPADALVIRDGKTTVARIDGGRAHYVPVDLGYNDGRNVRVLHGLRPGETIALDVPVEVADGDVVQATRESAGDSEGGAPGADQGAGESADASAR
jgi:RND family efflux transporter MFP subunit